MFKSLKEKLSKTVEKFSKKVEEETIEEVEEVSEDVESEEVAEEVAEDKTEEEPEEKGFFQSVKTKLTKFTLTEEDFEEIFWDIELELMENNVAESVINAIKEGLKEELVGEKATRKKPEQIVKDALKKVLQEVLQQENIDIIKEINKKKPYVIAIIGVNGSGKTTTLAKLAYKLKEEGKTVIVAASDTFRAAAIQQLQNHTEKLGIKLIKHDYQSDPAAVAFDAIKHAEATKADVVLIDTAGRLHSNSNLMNELEKVIRISKPDMKIFVGESITGNDCVEQASKFNELIGIDANILSKADVDEKGGAAVSVSHVTKKPVLYIGVGQDYKDLKKFEPEEIIEGLMEW